ncbi:MAG TPA: hypothetical protein VGR47_04435 [Terracidiphilus sp.]|nr:hypothetical protein [Terracidiphilus sp.]
MHNSACPRCPSRTQIKPNPLSGTWRLLALIAVATPIALVGQQPAGFGLEGTPRTIGSVGYIAPRGWSVRELNGMVVMTGPVPRQYQPCMLVIVPDLKPPAGHMATQLVAIVDASFSRQFGPYHGENGQDIKADQYKGVSVAGWPYVDLLGQLGNSAFHVRALLARYNDRAVALMGLFNAVDCLGSYYVRDNDTFLMLFHSLRLPGFDGASTQLAKQIIGSWQSVSGSAGVMVIYAANGHYDDGAVATNYVVGNDGLIYDHASHFAGSGTYRIDGDRVTMTGHGAARTELFSIVRKPRADRVGEYDEILRLVEPTDNQVWGFARTGYYVISYNRSH